MTDKKPTSSKNGPIVVDWETVRRRLADVQAVMDGERMPTLTEQNKILKARAKIIAQEPLAEPVAKERIEIVEFLLAHEWYGIESSYVREICPLREFTPLPCTPAFVLGIVNLRGQILSILDIRKFFELPEKGLTDLNKIVVVQVKEVKCGILADAIGGVRSILRHEIQLSLPTLTGIREDYLLGMTKARVVLLDVMKLLSDKKMIVQEEVEV